MADLKYLHDDWPVISQRLDEALALAPLERNTWLDALPETDAIKQKLRDLLADAEDIETGDFLDTLPKLTLDADQVTEGSTAHGAAVDAIVGPYRLIRELGAGGMGSVWLAERIDGTLKREVALKLPRLSWSSGLAERMSRERDILASLNHPNIAHIYDAGLDEQGRPYLALEYIEGEPINIYCRQHSLSIRERLKLILQVSAAVAHAHARLVLHRDLKPANILVTHEGQVRLLDFGIAKLMEGELTQETQLTQLSGRALTLDYASPEQIRGEPIGTASDVYSLGVVAYELLTEAKPYKLKRESAAALEEAIATVDVRLASHAATKRHSKQQLKGDIDAILNKALKKDVTARYPTIDAFAQDIERYLNNLPVQARADAWRYRVQKFLNRNKWPVAAAAAITITLIAGVAGVMWQAKLAAHERDRALENADRTELANGLLLSVIQGAGSIESPVIMRDLLIQSEKLVDEGMSKDPAQQASMFRGLAITYFYLGHDSKAHELLQRAKYAASQTQDEELTAQIACPAAYMSSILLNATDAKREMTRALESLRDDIPGAALCLNLLAVIAQRENDAPLAVKYSERALSTLQKLRRPHTQLQLDRAIRARLTTHRFLNGEIAQADLEFGILVKQYDALGAQAFPEVTLVRNDWALLRIARGDAQDAIKMYDQLIQDASARSPDGSAPAYTYTNRGRAHYLAGDYDAAIAENVVTLKIAANLKSNQYRAFASVGLAEAWFASGNVGEAEKWLAQAKLFIDEKLGQKHPAAIRLLMTENDLAIVRGNYQQAHTALTGIIDLLNDGRKPTSTKSQALLKRSLASLALGQTSEASKDADQSLEIAQLVRGTNPHSYLIGNSLLAQACISAKTGNAEQAHALAEEAMSHFTHAVSETHNGRRVASELVEKKISVCPAYW
jgi:eukaryotic-like serine/threonine-protein kinase